MLNILISETDSLFQSGLQYFFMDFFWRNFNDCIHFDYEMTPHNVSTADIIVLSLCQGETLTCFPELQSRQKGIVIGWVDDEQRSTASQSCYQDIIFISRRASLDMIGETVWCAWRKAQLKGHVLQKTSCFDCEHKILSPQQIRIVMNLYKGLSVMQTADALQIGYKTVFAHKYMIMQKFNLRSDYELIALLNRMVKKNGTPNIFRDSARQGFQDRPCFEAFI